MMHYLMALPAGIPFEFEVRGPRLLVSCPRLEPGRLIPLLGVAQGFHERVPRMVLREYATAPTASS